MIIDRAHTLCSKAWQYLLSILFSDQEPNERNNPTLLQYFAHDSLWLDQGSLFTTHSHSHSASRPAIDFDRLPTWRFTIRRRTTTHGASEYYSDMELEQSTNMHSPHCTVKKSFIHRRITNLVSLTQQENCYTSESDENNNPLKGGIDDMNSSEIYQCSICLEKYFNNVYICTLPCLHHFHRKCLFDWLCNSEHTTCPLCRSPVVN